MESEPIYIALLDDDVLTRKVWSRVAFSLPHVVIHTFGDSEEDVLNFANNVVRNSYDICVIDINLDSVTRKDI